MRARAVRTGAAALVTLCLGLVGCQDDVIIEEPVGCATFFVENQTAQGMRVTMTLVPQESGTNVEAPVPAFTRAQIHETCIIGVNPRPTDALVKIEARDSAGTLLYVQEQIDNAAWSRLAPHEGSRDYYAAEYTLVIGDADLLAQ